MKTKLQTLRIGEKKYESEIGIKDRIVITIEEQQQQGKRIDHEIELQIEKKNESVFGQRRKEHEIETLKILE